MQVMVLGGTGFIGPAVTEQLSGLGHEVTAVSRRGGSGGGATHVAADRGDVGKIVALAADRRVEVVIDLLAMSRAATQPLLDALSGVVRRYVLASSGDVYRQYGALHRLETTPIRERLDEDAPLRTHLHPYRGAQPRAPGDPEAWLDRYDKVPIEAAVRMQAGLEHAIVRLPMVYGPRDRQRRFSWALRPMAAGEPVVELDSAWADWRTSYGYVDDVAFGLALAATHPAAAGRTYNLAPTDAVDHAAWAARFAEATGWDGEVRRLPREAVPEGVRGALDALDLSVPMVLDSGRIRAELAYAEPTPLPEAIARTLADEIRRA